MQHDFKNTLTPDFALCISNINVKLGIWGFLNLYQIYFTVYGLINLVLKKIPTSKIGRGGGGYWNLNIKLTWNNSFENLKKDHNNDDFESTCIDIAMKKFLIILV